MEQFNNINEVAKLFGISVATLHYWEKEGLFKIKRNEENRYRQFDVIDILNLWEIVLYRGLNIPIKNIRDMLCDDVAGLENIYTQQDNVIQKQIIGLNQQLEAIGKQKRLIQEVYRLQNNKWTLSKPDFRLCITGIFNTESTKLTLEDPYRCALFIPEDDSQEFIRGLCLEDPGECEVIWEMPLTETRYVEFLLQVNYNDERENNLDEIKNRMRENGMHPGKVIARYLIIAGYAGKRYEYYRAWVEVIE